MVLNNSHADYLARKNESCRGLQLAYPHPFGVVENNISHERSLDSLAAGSPSLPSTFACMQHRPVVALETVTLAVAASAVFAPAAAKALCLWDTTSARASRQGSK